MEIRHIVACVMAVALGASPLAHSTPGGGGVAAGAEAGWTSGFDLAGAADGGELLVVVGWTNGFDLAGGADGGALPFVVGWTNGYDLPSGGGNSLRVAAK